MRMAWMTFTVVALVLALALPAVARDQQAAQDRPSGAAGRGHVMTRQTGEVRHSGKVVEVSRDGGRFVLEEMLAWQGPEKPGIVRRTIDVTPRTAIQLVERTGEWGHARTSLPGWDSNRIAAQDLRVGDFVTVTTDDDARSRAVALQVIRPGS
jgi:hypothetical protein